MSNVIMHIVISILLYTLYKISTKENHTVETFPVQNQYKRKPYDGEEFSK